MNPPTSNQPSTEAQEEWSTGLFDCFSDFKKGIASSTPPACITCWFPCVTFGQVAEVVDKGSTSCGASGAIYALINCFRFGCLYSCYYRSKMRQQYKLKESPTWDWLVHCCCEPCALCQKYRELENRGFDMAIDWHGNVDQLKRGVAKTPKVPAVEQMNR